MTPKQQKVYEYIVSYTAKNGREPSTLIIAKHFNVSHQSIQQHIKSLFKKQYLRKREYIPQGEYEVVHR